jgi:transposase
MPGVLHALCNAHHLRELKALVEIEKEDWARKMQRVLLCHDECVMQCRAFMPYER